MQLGECFSTVFSTKFSNREFFFCDSVISSIMRYLRPALPLSSSGIMNNNIMYRTQQQEQQQIFKVLYQKSTIWPYVKSMNKKQSISQPAQTQKKATQQGNVDKDTFEIMRNFHRQEQKKVERSTRCFLGEKKSFFSCFSSDRKQPSTMTLQGRDFFITTQEELIFYVDLDMASEVKFDLLDKQHLNIIIKDQKKINVEVSQQDSAESWLSLLQATTRNSKSKLYHHIPYNQYYTSNEKFMQKANTGDILLFRSTHSAARVQRIITNSEYDHVGMVLRNKKNELFLFESDCFDGVNMTLWKQIIRNKWYEHCEKVCWRVLEGEVKNLAVGVENFVMKSLGKKFEVSLQKLFKKKSSIDRTKEEEDKKTYFCSELVARLYKQLGLLDPQRASSKYYPVDFSQKSCLNFINPEVSLSHEITLLFQ